MYRSKVCVQEFWYFVSGLDIHKWRLPTSWNILPIFQIVCPIGVQTAQTVVHFAHLQVQAKKRGVLGWAWGVLCTYISPKGVCDGCVKNRGWGWYSGQNETPYGQTETHLGNLYEKWAKCSRIGGKIFNHLKFNLSNPRTTILHAKNWLQVSNFNSAAWRPWPTWLSFFCPILEPFCPHYVQIAQMSLFLPRWGLALPRIPPPTPVLHSAVKNPFRGNVRTQNTLNSTPKHPFAWPELGKMNYSLGKMDLN